MLRFCSWQPRVHQLHRLASILPRWWSSALDKPAAGIQLLRESYHTAAFDADLPSLCKHKSSHEPVGHKILSFSHGDPFSRFDMPTTTDAWSLGIKPGPSSLCMSHGSNHNSVISSTDTRSCTNLCSGYNTHSTRPYSSGSDHSVKVDKLSDLLEEQRLASTDFSQPVVRVTAGPGSGKTKLLVARVQLLVKQGVSRRRIAVVTYSRKAAASLIERIEAAVPGTYCGSDSSEMGVGTFHSLCLRLLRKHGNKLHPAIRIVTIVDEKARKKLISNAVSKIHPELSGMRRFQHLRRCEAQISLVKSSLKVHHGLTLVKYLEVAWGQWDDLKKCLPQLETINKTDFFKVLLEYNSALEQANLIDFEDMLSKTGSLLALPGVQEFVSKQYAHILVDEFQDTNILEYEILKRLKGSGAHLFVVGDPNQAIYGWRGAITENLDARFTADFHHCTSYHHLEHNHRSTRKIIEFNSRILEGDGHSSAGPSGRPHKDASPVPPSGAIPVPPNGRPATRAEMGVEPFATDTDVMEAKFVARRIQQLTDVKKKKGAQPEAIFKLHEVAVLYRTKMQSRVLEEALQAHGIRFVVPKHKPFWCHPEVQDVGALLRLVSDPLKADSDLLQTILTRPWMGLDAGSRHLRALLSCGGARSLGTLLFEDCLPPGQASRAEKERARVDRETLKAEKAKLKTEQEHSKANQGPPKTGRQRTQDDKDKTKFDREDARIKREEEQVHEQANRQKAKAETDRIKAVKEKLDSIVRKRRLCRWVAECVHNPECETLESVFSTTKRVSSPMVDELLQFSLFGFQEPLAPDITEQILVQQGLSATAINEVKASVSDLRDLVFLLGRAAETIPLSCLVDFAIRVIGYENWMEQIADTQLDAAELGGSGDEAFKRLAQLRISAMQFSTKTKHIWKAAKDKALLDASKGQPVRDGDEYQDDNQSLYDDAENFSLTTHRLPAYVTHVTQMIRTAELASQQSEVEIFEPNAAKVEDTGCVRLMTFHAAKGLEFPCVFVTGVEEGLVPHFQDVSPEEKREARRLLYVACSRASKHLVVSWSLQRPTVIKKAEGNSSLFLEDTLKSLSRSNTTSILQLSNSKDKHYQAVRGHATSLVLQAIQRQQTTEEVGGQEAVGDVCSRRSPRQGRNVSSAVDTQKHDTSDEEILAVSREAEEQCHLERASKCG